MGNETEHVFHDVVLADLAQIRQYVGETATSISSAQSVSQSNASTAINELILAVNEAVANIIRHGYQDKTGDITIQLVYHSDTMKVILRDNSHGFDPTTVSSPDMTLPLEERPFGGMGVHMMREFCDELSYHRNENDENELNLIKRINHPNRLDQS